MLEFSSTEQRTARKDHECEMCGKPIIKGCAYICERMKYDGRIHTCKRHIHCDALLDAFLLSDRSDGSEYSLDEVSEWLSELCGELYNAGKCPEEDYEENCDRGRLYECPLIFEKALRPEIRRAAEQSVKDNARQEN